MPVLDRKELEESPLSDLHAIASELGIEGYRRLRRDDLIDALAGDGGSTPKPRPRTRTRANKTEDKPAAAESRKGSDDDEDDDEQPRSRSRSRSRRGRGGSSAAKDDAPSKSADQDDDAEGDDAETEPRTGVLDILPNGSGFMRPDPFAHSREDVYVSPAQIRRCGLRAGDEIVGPVRPPRRRTDQRPRPAPPALRALPIARPRAHGQRPAARAAGRARPLRRPHAGL